MEEIKIGSIILCIGGISPCLAWNMITEKQRFPVFMRLYKIEGFNTEGYVKLVGIPLYWSPMLFVKYENIGDNRKATAKELYEIDLEVLIN
jgi:hypothetical protein